MKILLVEDNHFKREKVLEFLRQFPGVCIDEAASYNRGLSVAGSAKYDLIVLDMSMPTFDRTDTERGGRFRVFGAKEIVSRLKRQSKLSPFVILTGYSQFSDEKDNLNLSQIHDLFTIYAQDYLGTIYFDSASSVWKQELTKVIEKLDHA